MYILCLMCVYIVLWNSGRQEEVLVALSLKGAHNYIIWLRDLFLYILLFAYNVLMNLYCFHAI